MFFWGILLELYSTKCFPIAMLYGSWLAAMTKLLLVAAKMEQYIAMQLLT